MHLARTLLLLAAVTCLASGAHAAGGVNLRWDQCFADGGVQNKNFACDTNDDAERLVGSFVPAAAIANVSGLEIVVDLASAGGVLPNWWSFRNVGSCRQASLSMNTVPVNPASPVCPDWSQANAVGGIGAYNIGPYAKRRGSSWPPPCRQDSRSPSPVAPSTLDSTS